MLIAYYKPNKHVFQLRDKRHDNSELITTKIYENVLTCKLLLQDLQKLRFVKLVLDSYKGTITGDYVHITRKG